MKKLTVIQERRQAVHIRDEQGKLLGVYYYGHDERHPYFHPLYSRQSREPLTCFAPWDHPWHKGLWWSWKYINGCLFWEPGNPAGNNDGDNLVVSHEAAEQDDGSARVQQLLEMRPLSTRQLLMTERRDLRLLPEIPGVPGAWGIDWSTTFRAEVDCELTATPFPEVRWGGYAGLNYRPCRTLPFIEDIVQAGDARGTEICHGRTARWAAYGGVLDGDSTASPGAPRRAGVAMLDYPGNLRHPTPWYHWSSGENNRGFGFLAAGFLMHESFMLHQGAELPLKYRVVIFDGPVEAQKLDAAWEAWVR